MKKRNGSTRAWRKLRHKVLSEYGQTCYYCGTYPANHVDHKSPVSTGGLDTLDNLVAACAACNLRKSNRTEQEFRNKMKKKNRNRFFESPRTPPTPSLSFSPEELGSPFELPGKE